MKKYKKTNIKSPGTFQERTTWKKNRNFQARTNVTCNPVFQNTKNILAELHLLLAPDHEHKKVFSKVPVAGFSDGKSLKDYLVRTALPITNETRRCEPCGKLFSLWLNKTY